MMLSFMLGRSYDRLFIPRHHFLFSFLPALDSLSTIENKSIIEHHAATAITISMAVTPIKIEGASPTGIGEHYRIILYHRTHVRVLRRLPKFYETNFTAPFSMAIFTSCRFEPPRGRVTEPGHSTTSAGEAAEPRSNSGTWVCP